MSRWHLWLTLVATCGYLAGCADGGTSGSGTPQQAGKPTATKHFDFKDAPFGKTPDGFTAALTGGGAAVSWVVTEDTSTPDKDGRVLVQTSADPTDHRFPLCVYNDLLAKDVDVSARFKAVAGKVDQAAGLVARYRDKDNYYVVRANALEDNVRLYKVEKGDRKQFAGASAKVAPGRWHDLKLSAKGSHFQVWFDGKMLFEADDTTFGDAGKAGLWTKADSLTHFDDLTIDSYDTK
jgi:hypothetical protein